MLTEGPSPDVGSAAAEPGHRVVPLASARHGSYRRSRGCRTLLAVPRDPTSPSPPRRGMEESVLVLRLLATLPESPCRACASGDPPVAMAAIHPSWVPDPCGFCMSSVSSAGIWRGSASFMRPFVPTPPQANALDPGHLCSRRSRSCSCPSPLTTGAHIRAPDGWTTKRVPSARVFQACPRTPGPETVLAAPDGWVRLKPDFDRIRVHLGGGDAVTCTSGF